MTGNDPTGSDGGHGKSAHGAFWRWLPHPLVQLVVAMRAKASKPRSWPMVRLDEHLLRDIGLTQMDVRHRVSGSAVHNPRDLLPPAVPRANWPLDSA
jgi:hypothetical protein